ncbi:universal stress protein [Nesterenkonia lutea]|uniref:Nucleotide-binding universal stress UspA family protein n=1 Tax=Nesterenkonia lutea TaxID=272919 RepID=A0ABR9JGC8_9MICC|nr:universal stress protein [Nesterenkonia lutea]MBE1524979.1 nucleotide-binding universal stress UspA family protein [Nesterenkonia lutea]
MKSDTYPAARPSTDDASHRALGVMVGFDGSQQAILALHYGAVAALRHGRVLTVVSAFTIPTPVYTTLAALPAASEAEAAVAAAETMLEDARAYLEDYPGEVTYRAQHGDPSGVLVDLSAQADFAVVGARGRGGFLGRVLGSVSSALPAHAHCPTVVVPRQYEVSTTDGAERFTQDVDSRPVLAGFDGSSESRTAVLQAAQAAQSNEAPLRMLLALPSPRGALEWYPELDSPTESVTDRRKTQLEESLDSEVVWVKTHYPSLEITATVRAGDPVAELVKQAREAQLTVVGTRGHSGFAGALLGSVSRGLLLRAAGPVMVVPDMQDERLRDQPGLFR